MTKTKPKIFRPYREYCYETNCLRIVWAPGTPVVTTIPDDHLMTLLKSMETGEVIGAELWAVRKVLKME